MFRAITQAPRTVGRRFFTVFNGNQQTVYLAGKAARVAADGTKADVDVSMSINARPSLNIVYTNTCVSGSENFRPQQFSEIYLVNKDGTAKIKTDSVEDQDYSSGTAKYTGPAFKWTAATASLDFSSGIKRVAEFNFKTNAVPFAVTLTGKDGKVIVKESGELKVVNEDEFTKVEKKIVKELVQIEESAIQEQMVESTRAE